LPVREGAAALIVLMAMSSCLMSTGGDASDPGARSTLLNFASGQRAEAGRIANPRLQGFSAPPLCSSAERSLSWKLAGGDAPVDAGATQGGDADDVAEAVERRLDILQRGRGV